MAVGTAARKAGTGWTDVEHAMIDGPCVGPVDEPETAADPERDRRDDAGMPGGHRGHLTDRRAGDAGTGPAN